MVYNPDTVAIRERLHAYLTAKLTANQLDAVQDAFGRGAFIQSPSIRTELFIEDKPEYHRLSHAAILRTRGDERPFLIIDDKTPDDGGIWYIDKFASEDEVEDGEAESTDVVWKIRLRVEDVPIMHANYSIGNTSIREDLDGVGVDYPTPVDFIQTRPQTSGLTGDKDRFIAPTWITAAPHEMEETTDPEILNTMSRKPEKMYRLKDEVARAHGLKNRWTSGSSARPVSLPDGSMMQFPEGSLVLQMDYDVDAGSPFTAYQRPEGSL